jgi:transposase
MAKRYRPVPRNQPFLLPPDMRDWLSADHPVFLVIEAVEHHLDTSAVHATRRAGRAGAAGYDPDMLTGLLVWAYANRVTSSRRIEALCRTDIAFRLICAGDVPDHVTIARFRAGLGAAAGALFDQVLMLCARLGMGQLGLVALDGTKVRASASAAANRTEEYLRRLAAQIAAEHAATDAAEDELFGPGVRGDELPPELADPRSRAERIAAALADLKAEREAAGQADAALAGAFRERQQAGQRTGPGPVSAAVALAEENLARVRAARAAELAGRDRLRAEATAAGQTPPRRARAGIDDHCRVRAAEAKVRTAQARQAAAQTRARQREEQRKGPGPVRNLTDPHSRLMPVRGGGFIQGYNAQNVTSSDGLIIATQLTTTPADHDWLEPMLRQAEDAANRIAAARPGGGEPIGLLLADAGYLSEHNLTIAGPDRLIATGKQHHIQQAANGQQPAGGWHRTGPATTAMAARLATSEGITAYRHRGHIAERPHGHIKHNMGLRQLSLRGITRARAEWQLACTVANLFKAITAGNLTRTTLQALAT